MKKFIKKFFSVAKEGIRIGIITAVLILLCLFSLHTLEFVDRLSTRIAFIETNLQTIRNSQNQQQNAIRENEARGDSHRLRIAQVHSDQIRRGLRTVLVNNNNQELQRQIRAVHSCFLVYEFAQTAENNCSETQDQYYCNIWQVYEQNCLNIDENGHWVLSPSPGVYNRLMILFRRSGR